MTLETLTPFTLKSDSKLNFFNFFSLVRNNSSSWRRFENFSVDADICRTDFLPPGLLLLALSWMSEMRASEMLSNRNISESPTAFKMACNSNVEALLLRLLSTSFISYPVTLLNAGAHFNRLEDSGPLLKLHQS